MHEMSYLLRVISMAVDVAKSNNAQKISRIEVEIGATSGVMPYYMHKYFPEASCGTILEGAELVCVEVPVKAFCEECENEYFPVRENGYLCPKCGGRKAHIIQGKGVTLSNVVLED